MQYKNKGPPKRSSGVLQTGICHPIKLYFFSLQATLIRLVTMPFFGIRAATNDRNYWSLLTRVFICFIFRFQSKYWESQTTTNIATNIAT